MSFIETREGQECKPPNCSGLRRRGVFLPRSQVQVHTAGLTRKFSLSFRPPPPPLPSPPRHSRLIRIPLPAPSLAGPLFLAPFKAGAVIAHGEADEKKREGAGGREGRREGAAAAPQTTTTTATALSRQAVSVSVSAVRPSAPSSAHCSTTTPPPAAALAV